MKLDPLTSAYLKVIEENASNGAVDATKSQVGKTFGHSENDKNVKPKHDGLENAAKDLDKVEEAPAELTTDGSESEPKEVKKGEKLSLKGESKNPFDVLFNKIISEDAFDFSTEDNSLTPDSNFGGPEGIGSSFGEESDDESEEFGEEEGEEEGEVESLEEIVSSLKDLLGKLEKHLGHEEEETEEGEEEGEEYADEESEADEFPEDEESFEEAVEAEVLGHALVDQEKLEAGQTKKSVFTVKGAVPVTKKKAEVVKGKKVTGKPESHSTEGGVSKLTAKSNNVGGVQTGKSLFDQ